METMMRAAPATEGRNDGTTEHPPARPASRSSVFPSSVSPSSVSPSRHPARSAVRGFTLIEILMVLAIMMLMMGMAMFAFVDFGREAKMRTATLNFRAAFNQTRQHAITHRLRTYLVYGNKPAMGAPPGSPPQRGYYLLSNAVDGIMGTTNYLTDGVVLTNSPSYGSASFGPWSIGFKLDGSAIDVPSVVDWSGDQRKIVLYETARAGNYIASTVQVFRLTGTIQRSE